MNPDDKERLVLALGECGRTCMMCGDGANDVGALKQAQVIFSKSVGRVASTGMGGVSDALNQSTVGRRGVRVQYSSAVEPWLSKANSSQAKQRLCVCFILVVAPW